jgi:hypothetical protein
VRLAERGQLVEVEGGHRPRDPEIKAGHEVTGTSRSGARADQLHTLGAEALVADALDPEAVRRAFSTARPDCVVHEETALMKLSPKLAA